MFFGSLADSRFGIWFRQNYIAVIAVGTAALALAFAAYTRHAWEDYYITFRSSQNLVEGNGLVFNVGERVHTFTSPLGVLLPALSAWITGVGTGEAPLWGYRVICIAALAGGVSLLLQIARQRQLGSLAILLVAGWLAMDAKTVDFTINGMETGLLVFFLCYALWAHLRGRAGWWHLGLAWAGLMWTRPDSFIYIGLLAAAVLLFGLLREGETRAQILVSFIKAGCLTTVLYLPWFAGAWWYYGTPIPHTVTAKSGLATVDIARWVSSTWRVVGTLWGEETSAQLAFLPSYVGIGGWPKWLLQGGEVLAGLTAIIWWIPGVGRLARVCSFTFFGMHVYLTAAPYYTFPWYLPAAAPFAIMAWAGVVNVLLGARLAGPRERLIRTVVPACVILLVGANVWTLWATARQLRAQQMLIEDGNRRLVGEYLREQASPNDTVFLEPLGYIGYFSGLRTYDFPGMSSPEVVAARKLVGNGWHDLFGHLRPDWIVLRPNELFRLEQLERNTVWRLSSSYDLVQTFDRSADVAALDIWGRNYLEHDAVFQLFRRKPVQTSTVGPVRAESDFQVQAQWLDGREIIFIHAGGQAWTEVPSNSGRVSLSVGLNPGAGIGATPSDGARFGIEVRDGPRILPLGLVGVIPNPNGKASWETWSGDLPSDLSPDAVLRISIIPGDHAQQDWTFITAPRFEP